MNRPPTPRHRRSIVRVVAVAAMTLLVLLGPIAPSGASPVSPTTDTGAFAPVRRGHFHIVVLTTSDWAQVDLPGSSAGHLTVTDTGNREVIPTGQGIVARGTAGTFGSVGVDVVTESPADEDTVRVSLRQGATGASVAWVENRTEAPRTVAATPVARGTQPVAVSVDTATFYGPTDLELAHVDTDHLVLAFAYPWFGNRAKTDPQLSVHPTAPLLASQAGSAMAAAQTARDHGIDGFIMSFAGDAANGTSLENALLAAHDTGGTAAALIEASTAGDPAVVEQWVREARGHADSPAYLRLDGTPVVFVWGAFSLEPGTLPAIATKLAAEGTPVEFVTDAYPARRPGIAGGYRYDVLQRFATSSDLGASLVKMNRATATYARAGATLRGEQPGLYVATVQPGFDDRPLRGDTNATVDWAGTKTYDTTWRAALASDPDWVVITSWNEWYEGTGIAPSLEHGDDALAATATWAARFHDAT